MPGGQASHTSLIENFFGFPDGIGGAELARLAGRQAERFGAELVLLRGVIGSSARGRRHAVAAIDGGYEVTRRLVIARPAWTGVGSRSRASRSCSAAASTTAPAAARPPSAAASDVVVVGAGNSAGQAVMDLADAGARVTMVVRGDELGERCRRTWSTASSEHPLIDVRLHPRSRRCTPTATARRR